MSYCHYKDKAMQLLKTLIWNKRLITLHNEYLKIINQHQFGGSMSFYLSNMTFITCLFAGFPIRIKHPPKQMG